jgi:tryptophanase
MMTGDESYAGARSFLKMKSTIETLFGMNYVLPTHQGRAAENVLFSALVKAGDVIPGNAHFDTTKGHLEFRNAIPIDVTTKESKDTQSNYPFKGNHDLDMLEDVMKKHSDKVPFIMVTITNNNAGGQPVSMECLRGVRRIADKYGKRVLFDSARFAENAYFIKQREQGYENKTIKEITYEMYSYCDVMTMSSKKDAIVNIGGFIATKHEDIYDNASTFGIMYEGFLTYGGLAGRDMAALAQGLDEGTEFDTLDTRIRQVKYLGDRLDEYGVPYQHPAGGHAIFIDANKVLPNMPKEQLRAQTLAIELYLEAGIRGVEIGALLADRDPITHENRFPDLEFLRLAIPRRVYTNNHIDVVAAALKNVYDKRETITKGFAITKEKPIMRHFTIELNPITN